MALFAVVVLCSCSSPQPELVTKPLDNRYLDRGQSLVNGLAACGFCHGTTNQPGAPLVGGRESIDRYGAVNAANLTPAKSGLAEWGTFDIIKALRTSQNREDEPLSAEIHAGYEWVSDEDLLAIIAYLKALPSQENEVDRRSISMLDRNTTGFWESRKQVTGYVPAINPRFQSEYGQYLVDHLARCQGCHNTPGGLIGGEQYLAGGRTIRNAKGERRSPNITPSVVDGIGSWSKEDIVNFLMSAKTPDNRFIDTDFCPVKFYSRAEMGDLEAIAHYLKSVSAAD
jgi:mono/diheme cytochrome c family protein